MSWLSVTATLARRELASLFSSAVAYAVLAVFAFATSLLFLADFQPGAAASLTPLFESVVWLLVFLAPACRCGCSARSTPAARSSGWRPGR